MSNPNIEQGEEGENQDRTRENNPPPEEIVGSDNEDTDAWTDDELLSDNDTNSNEEEKDSDDDELIGESSEDDEMSDEPDRDPTYAAVFMPTKPRMGGIIQAKSNEFVVWTGGKPKVEWTELDDSAPKEPLRSL